MKIEFDEKGKYYTDIVSKDALPATIQTQTHRIRGNIYVREEERVKDALEKSGHLSRCDRRDHIRCARPGPLSL